MQKNVCRKFPPRHLLFSKNALQIHSQIEHQRHAKQFDFRFEIFIQKMHLKQLLRCILLVIDTYSSSVSKEIDSSKSNVIPLSLRNLSKISVLLILLS